MSKYLNKRNELQIHKVDLQGTVLKPNMVIPGSDCKDKSNPKDIAKKTLDCLKKLSGKKYIATCH